VKHTVEIKASERASFIGATGSGKTVLASHLLSYAGDRVVVIDPKHTFKMDGFEYRKGLPFFGDTFKAVYRPDRDEDNKLAEFISRVYKRGNVIIYLDELATLAKFFPKATNLLEDVARTGRERHISLWSATQRPRHVPVSFFTECEVWFVFLLRDIRDRTHLRDMVGDQVIEKIPLYKFWYARPGMEEPKLMTLDLNKNQITEVKKYEYERVR